MTGAVDLQAAPVDREDYQGEGPAFHRAVAKALKRCRWDHFDASIPFVFINDSQQRQPRQVAAEILMQQGILSLPESLRKSGCVWGDQQVLQTPKRRSLRKRLLDEHIERRAADC